MMKKLKKKKNDEGGGVVHVAILPSPGTGHIIPNLEFAKRLVTLHHHHHHHDDFKVTFFILSTEDSITQTQLLLQSQILPPNLHILHLPPIDISPFLTTHIQTRISIIIRESLPHIHSSLDPSSHLPDVLIVDFFATDAFQVADKLGIPKFIFFTSPALLLAFMLYLPTLDRQIIIDGEFVHLSEPIRVPGCTPIRIDDLVEVTRNRTTDGYKWFLHHASRFHLADGILVNTCQDLESKTLKALREDPILRQIPTPRVFPVGPIIRTADEDEDEDDDDDFVNNERKPEWLTWLDQQPSDSVLFVSFGSGGALTLNQQTELAWGLELSQQRFIWVARKPIQTDTMQKFLDDDPASMYLPDGFLDRIQGRGLVVQSWASQVQILSHKSTGGFLSHCGWNSSLESMYYGVPIIAWPLYAEQKMNATMLIEEIGVAVRGRNVTDDGLVGREEIERVVRLVMDMEGRGEEGKGLRRRVAQVRETMVRAVTKEEGDDGSSCISQVRETMVRAVTKEEGDDGSSCISLNQVSKEWKASVLPP